MGTKMILKTLTCNYLINIGVISWITAQIIKTLLFFVKNKKMNFKRLSEAGGMPSAHSALVCSVALGTAYEYGLSSPYFSLALTVAMVVLYDAMGVRRAAGEQAKAINEIRAYLSDKQRKLPEEEKCFKDKISCLNESLGHTPREVLGGILLGFCVATIANIWCH